MSEINFPWSVNVFSYTVGQDKQVRVKILFDNIEPLTGDQEILLNLKISIINIYGGLYWYQLVFIIFQGRCVSLNFHGGLIFLIPQ